MGRGIGTIRGIGALVPGVKIRGTGVIPGIADGVIPDATCLGEGRITTGRILTDLIPAGPSFRAVPSIIPTVPVIRVA